MAAYTGRMRRLAAALIAAGAAASAPARADTAEVDSRLTSYEAELRQLTAELPRPNQLPAGASPRRLVDAEVAYSLGDYDRAALLLFELASQPGPDREPAMFYLAESLFQKGDRGAARSYYRQVVAGGTVASKLHTGRSRNDQVALDLRLWLRVRHWAE